MKILLITLYLFFSQLGRTPTVPPATQQFCRPVVTRIIVLQNHVRIVLRSECPMNPMH